VRLHRLATDDAAVSPVVGIALLVGVTVILAALVGAFTLGVAGSSTEETPAASVETEWGQTTITGTTYDTVDITILGGDTVAGDNVIVRLDGDVVWNDDAGAGADGLATYDGKTWADAEIDAGDTLGLREDSRTMTDGNELEIVWNNGQKSQVLGIGTVQ
jgi:FlaG/FlaF family flagellin (archaellin)